MQRHGGRHLRVRSQDQVIRLEGVCKSYGHLKVLDKLDLSVHPGSFTVLEGLNGSGKTTLLEVVAGVLAPDSGSVSVYGDVFYIPQNLHKFWALEHETRHCFIPHLSVMENLLAAVGIVEAETAAARIEEWLTRLGLSEYAEVEPSRLSYGLQQRVALARALLLEPRVLLLDEGFSALYAGIRSEALDIVSLIPKRTGAAVVYVSHAHPEARAMADAVFRMHAGKAVPVWREGPKAERQTQPLDLRRRIRERLGDFRMDGRRLREKMIGAAEPQRGWRPEKEPGTRVRVRPGQDFSRLSADRKVAVLVLRPGDLDHAMEAVDGISRAGFKALDLEIRPESRRDSRLPMFLAAFSHYTIKRMREDGRLPYFIPSLRRRGAGPLRRLAEHLKEAPEFVESYVDRS